MRALHGLSIAVEPGIVFALLGPNGAGKSTTVKILTTLAAADEGSATVAGTDVRRDRPAGSDGPSAWSPSAPARTGRPPAGRTCGSRAASTGCAAPAPRPPGRAAGPLRPGRRGRTAGQDLLRRHAAAPGRGARPGPPPGLLSLDEPTTGLDPEARAACGGARPARRRGGPDHPADHPLPGGGRPVGRPAGDRRPGPGGDRGYPRRAQGRAARRRRPLELGGRARRRGWPVQALGRAPRVREITVDGRRRQRPCGRRRRRRPGGAGRAGADRRPRWVGHRRRPSLDDVYLRHAGRLFRQAEGITAS